MRRPSLTIVIGLLVLLCVGLGGLLGLLSEALFPGFRDTWVHALLVGAIVGTFCGVATGWLGGSMARVGPEG